MEWLKLAAAFAASLVAIMIAVFGWYWQKRNELQAADKKAAALYVNPFLAACNDFQGRIYNILMLNGLSILHEQQPQGEYAPWTLYLVAQYFGWVGLVRRYTHYGQDQKFIELTEKIRNAFASESPWGNTPFRFGRPEQSALGQSVIVPRSGEFGSEFDSLPVYQFQAKLVGEPGFADSTTITATLEALKTATRSEMLRGHGRIALIQSLLVDLLTYVEDEEGFTVFFHDELPSRKTAVQCPLPDKHEPCEIILKARG